jgi:hypothetical protein
LGKLEKNNISVPYGLIAIKASKMEVPAFIASIFDSN